MSMERIKRDAQQADQMIASLGKGTEDDGQPTDEAVQETSTSDVSEGGDKGLEDQPINDPGTAQNDPGTTDHDTTMTEAERWKSEAERQEQRYRSLDGMIQARDRQIQQLHELLAGLQAQQTQSNKEGQDHHEAPSSDPLITKEDETAFGDDLVDMTRRAAREEINTFSQSLQRQFDELRNELKGISQTANASAAETFNSKLDKKAPKWRELDEDPRFMEWLDQSSARKQVFVKAASSKDANTVADFFNEFARLVDAATAERDAPAQNRKQELERQVAPGKARKTPTPESRSDDKKVWKRSEIVSTYANKRQYSADEFAKLEREIAAAQREGRVDLNR